MAPKKEVKQAAVDFDLKKVNFGPIEGRIGSEDEASTSEALQAFYFIPKVAMYQVSHRLRRCLIFPFIDSGFFLQD